MIDIDIMQDASEIIHYDFINIPLAIQERLLSSFTNWRALCHWHDDIELVHVLDGEMNYDINGKKILLKKGDTIMVNSQQLHYGYSNCRKECYFIVVLFHPDLLKCNSKMYQQYVKPVIKSTTLEYFHLKAGTELNKPVSEIIIQLFDLISPKKTYGYQAVGLLYSLWNLIYNILKEELKNVNSKKNTEKEIQKVMVAYIYQHYQENLTLTDIASAGNTCRSNCCKLFQKYLQQSPIDFLNAYRLKISQKLLKGTSYSITEIATACGYNYLSYYTKIFNKKFGITPSAYRKKEQTNKNTAVRNCEKITN